MTANEILTLTVAFLAFLAAAGSAVYAGRANERSDAANRISESALRFQVLVPILTDYMSTDMYVAISQLWDFYQKDPETLAARYRSQREEDLKQANELFGSERAAFMQCTLDHQRRRVGQFYGLLTSIYDEGGHQRKWVYTFWRKRELQILPKIIIPLEEALAQSIDTPASKIVNERLKRLYDDCPT
jgi:hypothetical protein